jgi:hypothetical protein
MHGRRTLTRMKEPKHRPPGHQPEARLSLTDMRIMTMVNLPVAVDSWRADLLMAGIQEIPVDGRIALLAVSLPDLHKDPADRFILATALIQQATLITADAKLLAWPGALARKDART